MQGRRYWLVSLFLGFFFVSSSLMCELSAQMQRTWYVPDDFSTIQTALDSDQVHGGDQILVRYGTYNENLFFPANKPLRVRSEDDRNPATIDGGQIGSVVTFACNNPGEVIDSDTVLNDFIITNGFSSDGGGIVIF